MASFLSIGFFVFIPPFYQKPAASHTRRRRFVFFYHYRNVSTDSPTVSRMFHAAPPPHQSRLRRASFPQGKLLYRAFGYRFYRNAPGKLSIPSPTGKGDRPQAVDEGRYSVVCYRNNRRKGKSTESHRRERPMCRSVTLQLQPLWTNRNHPRHVIPRPQ